jgi:hypothetical protein
MGMDPRRRGESVRRGDLAGPGRGGDRIGDDDHMGHARGHGAGGDRLPIVIERGIPQVAMGVDQHGEPAPVQVV